MTETEPRPPLRPGEPAPDFVLPAINQDGTVALAASLDPRYDATVDDMQKLLASGRGQLDTSTVRILEQNTAKQVRRFAPATRRQELPSLP